MRRNTAFSDLIHLFRTDLYFKDLALIADDRCMQRLVHVLLRNGNIILQTARNRLVLCMNIAKDLIAVELRLGDDADRKQVQNLVEALMANSHLVIDRIEVFRAAEDAELNIMFR